MMQMDGQAEWVLSVYLWTSYEFQVYLHIHCDWIDIFNNLIFTFIVPN